MIDGGIRRYEVNRCSTMSADPATCGVELCEVHRVPIV